MRKSLAARWHICHSQQVTVVGERLKTDARAMGISHRRNGSELAQRADVRLFDASEVIIEGLQIVGAAVKGFGRRRPPDANEVTVLQPKQGGGDVADRVLPGLRQPPLLDALKSIAGILMSDDVPKNLDLRLPHRVRQYAAP